LLFSSVLAASLAIPGFGEDSPGQEGSNPPVERQGKGEKKGHKRHHTKRRSRRKKGRGSHSGPRPGSNWFCLLGL